LKPQAPIPQFFKVYNTGVFIVGVGLVLAFSWFEPVEDWVSLLHQMALFTGLVLGAYYFAFQVGPRIIFSMDAAIYIASILAFGPVKAAWLAIIANALNELLITKRNIFYLFRSSGMYALMVMAAGHVYIALGYVPGDLTILQSPLSLLVFLLVFTVYSVLNNLIISLSQASVMRMSATRFISENFVTLYFSELAMVPLGVMIAWVNRWGIIPTLLLGIVLILGSAILKRLVLTKQDLERRIGDLNTLTSVSQIIGSTIYLDDLCNKIYEQCKRLAPVMTFSIALHKREKDRLEFVYYVKEERRLSKPPEPDKGGISETTFSKQEPVVLADMVKDAERQGIRLSEQYVNSRGEKATSALCIPLVSDENIIGAMCITSSQKGAYHDFHIQVFTILGNYIASALVNANLYKQLENLNQELEEKVRERTGELESAMEKALESDRLKSEFLANMSHELRTPLNAIIGFTELVMDNSGDVPKRQRTNLGKVIRNARHLLEMINHILDLSMIESGRMDIKVESFDLMEVIDSAAVMISPMVAKKGIKLSYPTDEQPLRIVTDRGKVKQILINLLSNAVKFTEEGGIELLADAKESDGGEKISITVRDTGIGIREQDIPKVFDKFRQVDGSSTREYGGTGLGLAITRQLCELLGGSISVQSTYGGGSTFTVVLPSKISINAYVESESG